MDLEKFFSDLEEQQSDDEIMDFCRKRILHGTPFVFAGRDDDFYAFRKRIAQNFSIPFHEVFITGSAKLGFSPLKNKKFDFDSDIDVALVSPELFERIMRDIANYQMKFRRQRNVVRENELTMYHEFLEYVAMGWIRPDKLPISFQMKAFKTGWFDFFRAISNGKSEVGNYKVNAGVFKSHQHLEEYSFSSCQFIRQKLLRRKQQCPSK